MSILSTQLLLHRRHLHAVIIPIFPTLPTTAKSNFHTSGALLRPGYKPERNPKIGITLEQLRMAARGQGRRLPICHEQQEKVMNALEAAKYEVCEVCVYHAACILWLGQSDWLLFALSTIWRRITPSTNTSRRWADSFYSWSSCQITPVCLMPLIFSFCYLFAVRRVSGGLWVESQRQG